MKKQTALFTTIIAFAAFLFMGCKEKASEIDENKPFSIVGLHFTIDTSEGKNQFPLYKDPTLDVYIENDVHYMNKIDPFEYLDDGMKLEILDYNDENRSAYVKCKKTAGWVPLCHYGVKFDKKIFLACVKPVLDGNEEAIRMLEFHFNNITVEESVEKLQFIIDYVGLERLKALKRYRTEDEKILFPIARLIDLVPLQNFGVNVTNPLHLLAEFANEDTWKSLDEGQYSHSDSFNWLYRNVFFDSEGVSAQIHAVKAGNLDALKYFYEHDIPNYYFAKKAEVDLNDKAKIFSCMMSTKDSAGKSLADCVAECDDEKIRNFMAIYDSSKSLSVEECLEYLRGIKKDIALSEENLSEYAEKWLYQVDFSNNKATVIEETKLLNPNGEEITVKPLEDVEILAKLEGEDLWDYGNQDFSYGPSYKTYFYRYNYYLVRNEDFKMGIIGGSSLVHYYCMGECYDGPDVPVGGCESLYSFHYRLLYKLTEHVKTSYFAELYEENSETHEVHYLETGYSEGPHFESEPVYLGDLREDFTYDMELVAYRDFEMEREQFFDNPPEHGDFYTFIFETRLDYPEVSFNCYTVDLNKRFAYNSFRRDAYNYAGKSEDDYYKYSYSYFESENRKVPECVFGQFEMYSRDYENTKCLSHHVEHLKLDSLSLVMLPETEEDLDYAPEW